MSCFNAREAWWCKWTDRNGETQSKIYFRHDHAMIMSNKECCFFYEEIKVPCGKCIGCCLDKANDWATRCWAESKQWSENCFITLTYRNSELPEDKCLCKKDVQDFFKRLRWHVKGTDYWDNPQTGEHENPIRYLLCGEYGPNPKDREITPFGRPHYHALIFNWKPKDLKPYKVNYNGDMLYKSKELTKIWGKGFVIVGNLTYQSACYVARYVSKKIFKDPKHADLIGIQKEFILSSRKGGLGLKYWKDNKEKIINNGGIFIKIGDKVKLKNIPRYYMRKWDEEEDLEIDFYKVEKMQKGKERWKEILSRTDLTESEYMKQLEESLMEKAQILRRDNQI